MTYRVFMLFSLLVTCMPSWALNFQQLSAQTQTPRALYGHFDQSKFLSSFDLTIQSKGQFHYIQNRSIVWQTTEPMANELTLTPDSIVNKQNGHELMRLDRQSSPTIALLSEIFFSVMTADWQRLEQHFTLTGKLDHESWSADLKPTNNTFSQLIRRVELSGDQFLKKVVLYEKSGDTTTIHFTNLKAEN